MGYAIIAVVIEFIIGVASILHLKMNSIAFLLVMLTTLVGMGSIAYFVLSHDTDGMG
jgi:hypothetical protein